MLLRASLLLSFVFGALACGTPKAGKLAVDTPALPYKAPDIEELSGVSEDDPATTAPEQPKPEADVAPRSAPMTTSSSSPPPCDPMPCPEKKAPPAKKTGMPAAPAKK